MQIFDEFYAQGKTSYFCGPKIKGCGCAITSSVMMLRYHGITEDMDGNDINPLTINKWLNNAKDYNGKPLTGYFIGGKADGDLNFKVIPEYSRMASTTSQPGLKRIVKRLSYGSRSAATDAILDEDLEVYQPVIMRTIATLGQGKTTPHYILATEKLSGTYRINDPYWYNTKSLNHAYTGTGDEMNYYNHYIGLRRFAYIGNTYDTRPVYYAGINITMASPAELLVTSPSDLRIGFDPINNISYNEIESGSYVKDGIGNPEGGEGEVHETKTIQIENPEAGEYKIEVIGTGEGEYTLYSHITDKNGQPKTDTFSFNISPDEIFEYDLDYNKDNIESSNIYIIDEEPPEAQIYFDTETEKLTIIGIDNITAIPTVVEEEKCAKKIRKRCIKKEYIYTIADEAGNTLKLWIEKAGHRRKTIVRIKKIQYNNDEEINKRVVLSYIWKKKNDNYTFLFQTISNHKEFIVNGIYRQRKDNTRIWRYDWEEHNKIKETKNGLVIIKLNTDEGRVDYEY